ncbi:MSMEG_6728 family protein [Embleya scabrispora]|uniref:MSMEG_6728 family protein n=1 Tax=Embleya scabrispora TaxID=159449 RepID=UPI001913E6F1|nr:MSMEG_6728 family protein [Embleya scabrispora]
MQTFLPDPGFEATARSLDDRRLGKQRVETFQILRALVWPTYGWKHHPAVAMWRGFVPALVCYGLAMCSEWTRRGFRDTVAAQLLDFTAGRVPHRPRLYRDGMLPPWLGDEALHISHRSKLVAKDEEYYRRQFGPDLPADLSYVWPLPCYPRWPMPGGAATALEWAPALHALKRDRATDLEQEAFRAIAGGRDFEAEGSGTAMRDLALLAGLGRAGPTLWFTGAPLPDANAATDGTRSSVPRDMVAAETSIARTPDPATRRAVQDEATAPVRVRFLRPGQPILARWGKPGLLVVQHDAEPVRAGRLRGVPRLRLRP